MKLEPIAGYLESKGIAFAGEDLFADHMPENVEEGVLLVSPLIGEQIDYDLPNYRKTSFQVIVRHTDRKKGVALAEMVMEALTLGNTDALTGISVKYMRPRHEPVIFPSSKGDYLEISVNYDTAYIRT
ncbi:MAG: hypothetical protein HRT93_03085 [Piscirickettsiaceae bacterium]|nr:hypothetical protein [Piscirickettsiaceae bacterium]